MFTGGTSARGSARPSARPLKTYLAAQAEHDAKTSEGDSSRLSSRLASDIKRLEGHDAHEGQDETVAAGPLFDGDSKEGSVSPATWK